MNTIQELQNLREQLIQEINFKIDKMIASISSDQVVAERFNSIEAKVYEKVFLLTDHTGIFKGKKPIGVNFPDGTYEVVRTWKDVVGVVLDKCNQIPSNHEKMIDLCGKLSGKKRVYLSDTSENMRSPLQIDKQLFVETHYDTETLLKILTIHILTNVGYDYSGITITIRND